jgi:serine protease Do
VTTLDDVRDRIVSLSDRVGTAVVGIGHRWAVGSGVVIGPNRVLTNAHNLRRDSVTVTFSDGRSATGTPAGIDVDGDVAVLDVDTGDVEPLPWNAETVGIGTPVFALANPGGRGLRVTFGFVSGTERTFRGPRGRRISGSIEHTAPLLPGSSGGPVVDSSGSLLGLNTNRLGEGFYLAIPADGSLRERVDKLAGGDSPKRARLGIAVAPSHVANRLRRSVGLPEAEGLLIREIAPESPAANAGLKEGDLIVGAGDRPIVTADDLYAALDAADDTLQVKILRGAEDGILDLTL